MTQLWEECVGERVAVRRLSRFEWAFLLGWANSTGRVSVRRCRDCLTSDPPAFSRIATARNLLKSVLAAVEQAAVDSGGEYDKLPVSASLFSAARSLD